MTTAWTPDHVRQIESAAASRIALIRSIDRSELAPGLIYWDMWPIQRRDGSIAQIHGRELWMALAAPDRGNPALRHFEARIRLLQHCGGGWCDLGPVLPDMAVPYEREWAGSAVTDGTTVSLYFTGAGVHDLPNGYQQDLFETHSPLGADGLPGQWTTPTRMITASSPHYMLANRHEGEAGKIKAFRDPAYFRDPADGTDYIVFTASMASPSSEFNGAVGIARSTSQGWELQPPLISANGVNNEMERAHVVYHAGRYLVFWSTQRSTFSPDLRHAPNGLYGMVADSLLGPYRPLNGSGLVLANPDEEPLQVYSWFVSAELTVCGFVDFWGLEGAGPPEDVSEAARVFGGVPAPLLQLVVDGDRCWHSQVVPA